MKQFLLVFVVGFSVLMLIAMAVKGCHGPARGFTPDDGRQPDREAAIRQLQKDGFIGDVKSGAVSRVFVNPDFILLDVKNQGKVLGVIYDWCAIKIEDFGCGGSYCSELKLMTDNGGLSGQQIGEFDPVGGVVWY